MSYLVIARRWRPQVLAEVIGQEHVTRSLRNALVSGRLAHAFLFAGTRGVGKTTVARILAKAINCLGPAEQAPCNACDSCLEINEGRSVDVQEIDGASNRGIEEVRELRENARYRPAKAKKKIYIIDEVHMLTTQAFNALLKTLEEPPEHVVFIFATTEAHKVPATILSRCQRYDFRALPAGLIKSQLKRIAAEEGLGLDDGAISLLARAARGSLRDSLSLLEQTISFAGRQISEKDVQEILGLVDPKLIWGLAQAVLERNAGQALLRLEEAIEKGFDLRTCHQELMAHFRNLIVLKVDPQAGLETLGLSRLELGELLAQAESASAQTLHLCLLALLETDRFLRGTTQPRFALELALLKLCHLAPITPLEEILAKLDRLKDSLGQAGAGRPASLPEASGTKEAALAKPLEDWPKFLAWLKQKNGRLWAGLAQTRPVALEGGEVILEQEVATASLAEASRRQELERLASQFFGRPLRFKLDNGQAQAKAPSDDELRQEALNHPLVQAACALFEGRPIEVRRPRGRPEEEE